MLADIETERLATSYPSDLWVWGLRIDQAIALARVLIEGGVLEQNPICGLNGVHAAKVGFGVIADHGILQKFNSVVFRHILGQFEMTLSAPFTRTHR